MIDVHFHAFNLRSVPLTGVIEQYARLPRPAAAFLDFVFTAMTRLDRSLDPPRAARPTRAEEAGSELESAKEVAFRDSPAARDPSGRRAPSEWQSEADVQAFVDSVPREVLMHEIATANLRRAVGVRSIESMAESEQGRRELVRSVLPFAPPGLREVAGVGVGGGLAFLGNMMSKERTLVERVRTNTPGAGLFVHLMMHMDPSFDDTSYYSYPRQIARVRALCADPYVGGRVCAFVAFNPYDPSSLATVERALHAGFVGVKFYPPMGYRASGNAESLPWRAHVTPAELESRVQSLMQLCARLDIPIMTHCTPQGMEADPCGQSGLNSDPTYWRSVLATHPALRLCFAHAGDHAEWFPDGHAEARRGWRDAIIDLCVRFDNVYCDLSHMGDVLPRGAGNPDRGRDALRSALIQIFHAHPRFAKKLMYGSDYPMPLPTKGWKHFASRISSVFDDGALEPHRPHVFFENARRYLAMGTFLQRCGSVISPRERMWQSRFA